MNLKKTAVIGIIIFVSASIVFAQMQSSPNYTLSDAKILPSRGRANSPHYSIRDAEIGDVFGGKASSPNYTIDASTTRRKKRPNPPTLNQVASPTNNPIQTLSGTKEPVTSIYINGYEAVPLNSQTNWSYDVSLAEGGNHIIITARNIYKLDGPSVTADIFLDTSAPSKPVVLDDGVFTTSKTQLHANWSSVDPQTGIVDYQYAIGTAVGAADVVNWTAIGTQTEVTRIGLSLAQGKTYYISAKARNGAGSWSEIGCSDGIKINQALPTIVTVQPADNSKGYAQDSIMFSISANDQDGDSLLYQLSADGTIIQPWQSSSQISWSTTGTGTGIHSVKIEVSDSNGGEVSKDMNLYLVRKPLFPQTQ